MDKLLGQRGFIFALTAIVLLLIGAFLGKPGEFPTVEAQTVFTPEMVFNLIGGLVTPLIFLAQNFGALLRAITARANNHDDPYKPSDFKSLFLAKEFWVYVVSAGVGLAQIFGAKVLDNETQIVISNGLMYMAKYLLESWGERPSGTVQEIQIVKLE
jgi:hypothetical protein